MLAAGVLVDNIMYVSEEAQLIIGNGILILKYLALIISHVTRSSYCNSVSTSHYQWFLSSQLYMPYMSYDFVQTDRYMVYKWTVSDQNNWRCITIIF
mgnify:CR=1 FL=1